MAPSAQDPGVPAGSTATPPDDAVTRDEAVALYACMALVRAFEERVRRLHAAGRVPGLPHLCTGQEAVAAGVCAALRKTDWIASTHRGHGHCLAKGADPARMMAEILGRATGYAGGRGGSMHLFDVDNANLGTNGIVGGGVPLAVGAALASTRLHPGRIAACFFGDGAVNQGVVLECFNMAALWKLPVLLVCEHNGYGEYTASDDVTAGRLQDRGEAFGLPTRDIDGMDVLKVRAEATQAAERARAGGGPTLLICRAWRYSGHHASDRQDYKDDEETRQWLARDPLLQHRHVLQRDHGLDAREIDDVLAQAEARIEAATRSALAAPEPDPALNPRRVHA